MGSKREYAQVEASASLHDGGNKRRKQYKNRPANDGSSGTSGQSLNEIKKRARDIQRRFQKADNIPADIQRNLERELAQCQRQIEDLGRKKRRSDMIGKYHHVRFYERQKAERLRKQLKKRLDKATDPEEKAKLEGEAHIADVDWHYAKFFPFMERYVGLYLSAAKSSEPSPDESEEVPTAKRALHSERPPMWKEIEAAMEKGERALLAIQERCPDKPALAAPQTQSRAKGVSGKKQAKGDTLKTEKKEKKGGKAAKMDEQERIDAASDGRRAKREREEQQRARDGEDGLGFFAF